MALPIYEHNITVTEDTVSPRGPLLCGTAGDERAARLHFCFAEEFADAADYSYRLEIVTGSGAYDITDRLTLADNEIVYDIPAAWTAAGLAAVRLIQFAEQDGKETARRYFPPVALQFAYRDEGSGAVTAVMQWQEYLTRAEAMLDELRRIGSEAEDAASSAAELAEECRDMLSQMQTPDMGAADITVKDGDEQFIPLGDNVQTALENLSQEFVITSMRLDEVEENINFEVDERKRHEKEANQALSKLSTEMGDIDEALDGIIAIQESLIATDGVAEEASF